MWRWCLSSEPAALQLRVEGSRRGKRGQRNSEHLTHMWVEKFVEKSWYITWKGIKRRGTEKKAGKKERERERAKGWRNTTVKRKNSIFSIILLGHVWRYFLYWCMRNSFRLILFSNIFSLDSNWLFLPFSTNLLFELFAWVHSYFGFKSKPVLTGIFLFVEYIVE